MLKTVNNEKGLTLVEILVVVVLIVVVLSLGYTVIHYSRTTFQSGTARAEVQQEVRLVSDYITQELRNATAITDNNDNNDFEKTMKFGDSTLEIKTNNNSEEVTVDGNKISSITLNVDDSGGKNDNAILRINIDTNEEYEYNKEILLNNLYKDDDKLDIDEVKLEENKIHYSLP